MDSKLHNLALVSSIVLAIAMISGEASAATVSQEVTEARQASQIWTTFALSPSLRANDLRVEVHNGKAVLTGKVNEDVSRDLAKQIALGVSGIKEVDNQIIIEASYTPPRATERSYGEIIDDATITSAVKSKLLWSRYADGLRTDVDTRSGKVTLSGTADSPAAKELAGRLAMNTRGVISVDNQLTVSEKKPTITNEVKASTREMGQDITDSWITTKVKSSFMYSSHIDSTNIKVNTDKGIVTLTGKVNSSAERELAIDLAKNLRGVKSVEAKGLTF
jgi:osmotically-inducible protein OsmY